MCPNFARLSLVFRMSMSVTVIIYFITNFLPSVLVDLITVSWRDNEELIPVLVLLQILCPASQHYSATL